MPPQNFSSYYELLEVNPTATTAQIEAAYTRISGLVAPDSLAVYAMLEEEDTQRLRQQVEQAYHILNHPERRAAYDRTLQRDPDPVDLDADEHLPITRPNTRSQVAASLHLPEPTAAAEVFRQPLHPAPLAAEVAASAPALETGPVHETGASGGQAPSVSRTGPYKSLSTSAPKRYQLHAALAADLTPETELNGALLRRLRESAEASLEDLVDITKINRRYLIALEQDDWDSLPANVYVRGFVSEYARALGMDAHFVAKSYMSQYLRRRGQTRG